MRHPSFTIAILLISTSACSIASNIGETDAGARADVISPPGPTGPYDECGNGMDDDVDGRIDEGCPCGAGEMQACFSGRYPNRRVGACADGMQRCEVEDSIEFGGWGACEGDVTPAEQGCDGVDDDCDGAVDEGCACEAGTTRSCAGEFPASGVCRAGSQACGDDGVWSACVGAVGPSAEDCSNDLDDDCDGLVNEGCGCVPEVEVCGDGVDNDCDGATDEPACRATMDGGGPVPDGGTPDGGLPGPTGIDRCTTADLTWDRVSRPATEPISFSAEAARGAWTGSGHVWAFRATDAGGGDWVFVSHYDASAAHVGTGRTAISLRGFDEVRGMVWTGAELVVAYTASGILHLQRLALDGSSLGAPVTVPGSHGFIAYNGARVGVGYLGTGGRGLFFRTFDAALAPAGPTVEVLPISAGTGVANLDLGGQGLAWTGQRWIFAWSRTDTTRAHMGVLTDTALESTRQAAVPGAPAAMITQPTLAASGDRGVWCFQRVFGMWDLSVHCERFDALGVAIEPAFELVPRASVTGASIGAIRWGDGFVLVHASPDPTRSGSFVLRDGSPTVESLAIPADMDRSSWGFSYWNSDFGEVLGAPDALVMSSRGDPADGRSGNVPGRVRLRCRR